MLLDVTHKHLTIADQVVSLGRLLLLVFGPPAPHGLARAVRLRGKPPGHADSYAWVKVRRVPVKRPRRAAPGPVSPAPAAEPVTAAAAAPSFAAHQVSVIVGEIGVQATAKALDTRASRIREWMVADHLDAIGVAQQIDRLYTVVRADAHGIDGDELRAYQGMRRRMARADLDTNAWREAV